jgi:hypothetical protein
MKHLGLWALFVLAKFLVGLLIGGSVYWVVMKMSPGAREFWVGVFSDSGTPSFSRVATGLVVVCACAWISYLVYVNHGPPEVGGIVLLIGTLYGINIAGSTTAKVANSVAASKGATTKDLTPPTGGG